MFNITSNSQPQRKDPLVHPNGLPDVRSAINASSILSDTTQVSIFPHAFGRTPRTVLLAAVIEDIRSGRYSKQVQHLRGTLVKQGKEAYDRDKTHLLAFTISGTCTDRKTMTSHSGLLQADLDGLNGNLNQVREQAKADPHVFAGFVSPSGNGLKLAVRIPADSDRHRESFEAVANYFRETYNVKIDPACKDPLRLCFVSSDPRAWLNDGAVELDVEQLQSTSVAAEPDIYDRLVLRHGEPYWTNDRGSILINQMFFVARFEAEHLVLHEPNERDFYLYDSECGVWVPRTADAIKTMFAEDWQRYANEVGMPALLPKRTNSLLQSLVSLLRGHVEKPEAFTRTGRIIHLANGMLDLDHEGAYLREFSPDDYSRNVCPISWDPNAECPRFKTELLETALDSDDISLLQRWCGSLLLGRNVAQKIMLFIGTPGGGKSTLLEIIEAVIGPANVCQLRTEHLNERFELSRFLRKTMLSGKDVKGDFLQTEGAHVLKALVGHDLLSAERKGSNAEFQLRGEFGVAVSCNSRLRVKLDGDVDAWRRRLLIIRYEKPKPCKRIPDFAKMLLREEASGILRWMVDGAIEHLRERDAIGDYRLTGAQRGRVDQLLAESDSIRHFVIERIRRTEEATLLPPKSYRPISIIVQKRDGWPSVLKRWKEISPT